MTYREASQVFKISQGAVGACAKLFKEHSNPSKKSSKKPRANEQVLNNYHHEAQVRELKQKIGDLYLENQMLKKILNNSLHMKKLNGSVITTENLDQFQEDVE
jgi:ATP-dependent Lon protease